MARLLNTGLDDWTLQPAEMEVVNQVRTDKNRLGLALLLKWFQSEHHFPKRRQDVPPVFCAHAIRAKANQGMNVWDNTKSTQSQIGTMRRLIENSYGTMGDALCGDVSI